jgi:hypothetical protein
MKQMSFFDMQHNRPQYQSFSCRECIHCIPKEIPDEEPDGLCRRLPKPWTGKGKRAWPDYERISTLIECPGFKQWVKG